MDRMLYLAMTGAKHAMQAQQHTSNNLANATTPGFRQDFDALISKPVYGPTYASRVYSLESSAGTDFKPGSLMHTGNEFDVAVHGEGWFSVQAPDGGEAYTRRGDFQVSPEGLLRLGSGELVLGEGGPVAIPPADRMVVGQDGTISVVPLGQDPNTLVVVDRLKLVNPDNENLQKGPDGLFRLADGGVAAPDAAITVTQGSLESSNVNAARAMVELIDNARQWETHVKMMRAAEDAADQAARLLRTSG